jgi:hypothetical protein
VRPYAEALRAKNNSLARDHSSLARELAQAREGLLKARELGSVPEYASKKAANSDANDAFILSLKGQVESLTVQLKDAYLRELEMRKALETDKTKGKEQADAATKETRRSAAAAAVATSPLRSREEKTTTADKKAPGVEKALGLLGATLEQRYAARRRAVGILCAVSSGKGEEAAAGVSGDDGEDGGQPGSSGAGSSGSVGATVGKTPAEQWKHARRSLASLSRLMNGPSSFMVYKQGALTSALSLMAAAPKDRAVQVAGCRVIASLVTSPHLVAHARRSPSFASGKALGAAAAVGLRTRCQIQLTHSA